MSDDMLDWINEEMNGEDFPKFTFKPLKLGDGRTIQIRFLEKPVKKYQHYTEKKMIVICPGEGCLFCIYKKVRAEYYFVNVLDANDNTVKALIFPKGFLRPLQELVKKEGDVRSYGISVTTTGKQRGTRYQISKIGDGEPIQSEKLILYDLEKELQLPSMEQMVKYFKKNGASGSNGSNGIKH